MFGNDTNHTPELLGSNGNGLSVSMFSAGKTLATTSNLFSPDTTKENTVATVHAGREEQFDTQQAANAGPEEECDGGDERTRAAVRYAAPPPRAGLSKRACAKSDLSAVPLNTTASVVYTPFKRPRVSANDQEHEQQEQEHTRSNYWR